MSPCAFADGHCACPRAADLIHVLDRGRVVESGGVVESGTIAELLSDEVEGPKVFRDL